MLQGHIRSSLFGQVNNPHSNSFSSLTSCGHSFIKKHCNFDSHFLNFYFRSMSRSFSLSAGQSKLQNDGTFKISDHDQIIPIQNEIVEKSFSELFSECSPPTLSLFKSFSNQLLQDFVQTGSRKRRITSENFDRTQENQSSASPSKVNSHWCRT